MKLFELLTESNQIKEGGWLNVKTQQWVNVGFNAHVFHLLKEPWDYGIREQELRQDSDISDMLDDFDDTEDYEMDVDGNYHVLQWMSKRGWVRIAHKDKRFGQLGNDTIIYGPIKLAHKAARIINKQDDIENLYLDWDLIGIGRYDEQARLKGKRLELFLKYGKIPSNTIREADIVNLATRRQERDRDAFTNKIKGAVDALPAQMDKQREVELQVIKAMEKVQADSLSHSSKYKNPTLLSDYEKGINPLLAWYYETSYLEDKYYLEKYPKYRFLAQELVKIVDELIAIAQEDLQKLEELVPLADTAPTPQYVHQMMGYRIYELKGAIEAFNDFKT